MRKDKKNRDVFILGFGRFGKLLANIFKDDFRVSVRDVKDLKGEAEKTGVGWFELSDLSKADDLFLCVPISSFPEVMKEIAPLLEKGTVVLDVASVKEFPTKVMLKSLPEGVEIINTHPMFGPDSARDGVEGLPMVMHKTRASEESYSFWKEYFTGLGIGVVEMTAEEHDREAAFSQGVTHYIGRLLEEMGLETSSIGTVGYERLLEVRDMACHDSWELFHDLQTHNRFTKEMRVRLGRAQDKMFNRLLPDRVEEGVLTVGVQGGEGSFNEQALVERCGELGLEDYRTEYLFTSEKVLEALYRGEVDRGQFALENSIGGVVQETIRALGRYKVEIVDQFSIVVDHHLLVLPGVELSEVDAIISHPQALAQCRANLEERYPSLKRVSGEGDLIDQANCARALGKGELPASYAVLAAEVCADKFGLEVIDSSLQDLKDNHTEFLWVERQDG